MAWKHSLPFSYFNFSFFQTSARLSITVWKHGKFTLFWVLPNFQECFYNVWEYGGSVFYFFYKITRRKLKRRNSLLFYQSANSPYCSRWRIVAWYFHVFHTVTEIWLLVNQRSHFVISINGDINVVCCVGRVVSLWRRANARNVRLWYPISVI